LKRRGQFENTSARAKKLFGLVSKSDGEEDEDRKLNPSVTPKGKKLCPKTYRSGHSHQPASEGGGEEPQNALVPTKKRREGIKARRLGPK